MTTRRQLWSWGVAASAALAFLLGLLVWERNRLDERDGGLSPDDSMARMWNHAPIMELHMRQNQTPWPHFEGTEIQDLLTYLRAVREGPPRGFPPPAGDAQRGRDVFMKKGCIKCHSIQGQGGSIGGDLSRGRPASDR